MQSFLCIFLGEKNESKKRNVIDFLSLSYNRKNVKNLLKYKEVYVNGKQVSQFDYLLKEDDLVEIKKENNSLLEILYEDQDFVVINKPSGLLSMSDGKEKEKTAYHYVSEYLKKQNKNQKVFIVHRLDRETSGVLMFCKNEKVRDLLQKDWNKIVYLRGYMALVEGKGLKKQGTLKNYLAESKTQQVYISNKEKGKLAITHYKVIKEMKNQTLLEINLDTGRKNQIRVQLSNINHPIVGDKKYGATSNPIRRLGLHAHAFGFVHPKTKKKYEFKTDCPKEFYGR